MRNNFEPSLALLLGDEGGYSNHPADNGGVTNSGVTQATYDSYRRSRNQPTRSVREITSAEVRDIYFSQYWNAVSADLLPSGVDYAVFDYAVHSGPKRAKQELQRVVGVADDGIIGPKTLAAVKERHPSDIIRGLHERRMAFLRRHEDWPVFGRGWTNRVNSVTEDALAMVNAYAQPYPNIPQSSEGSDGTPTDETGSRGVAGFLGKLIAAIIAAAVAIIFGSGVVGS